MNDDELPEYVRELTYRAIATELKIGKDNLIASPEAKAKVHRCLMIVKAIADNQTLDGAVDDLIAMLSESGNVVSRKAIQREVNACYDTFNIEIAGIERMFEMHRKKFESKDIWDFLRSRVPVGCEYEDDWLHAADAWILRGEKLDLILGTAEICSFSNPADQAKSVHRIIKTKATKRKNPKS